MKKNMLILLATMLTLLLAAGSVLAFNAPGSSIAPAPDFDIRGAYEKAHHKAPKPAKPAQEKALNSLKDKVKDLKVRWSTLTGSPSRIHSMNQYLTGPSGASAKDIAKDFLKQNLDIFDLSPQDVSEIKFSRDFVTKHNGVTHLTMQQRVNGIDVFGGALNLNVDKEGRVLNISGEPMRDIHMSVNTDEPSISAEMAVINAAAGAGVNTVKEVLSKKLVYFPIKVGNARLAHDVIFLDSGTPNMYRSIVDAVDGTVLWRQTLTRYSHVLAHGEVYTGDSPDPNTPMGTSVGIVPRVDAPFNGLLTFPHEDPHADWWNGSGQPDRSATISNNVSAQEDRNGDDADGFRPTAGAGENFTFPIDLTQDPITYQSAAIVNLFYWTNLLHDIFYKYGFNEAAGNFQVDNFGLGGLGGDSVQADAQDNRDGAKPGLCDANFGTLHDDGSVARMQMYTCNLSTPERDGDLDNVVIIHEYTHGVSGRLVVFGPYYSQSGGLMEGWSDFMAISIPGEPDDDLNGIFREGQWLFNGGGRSYTTDQTLFTATYADINNDASCLLGNCSNDDSTCTKDEDCGAGNTCNPRPCNFQYQCAPPEAPYDQTPCRKGPHRAGPLWTEVLWLARTNLLWKYGFTTGHSTMMKLSIDGMKLAPANPDFLDSRDAILQADLVNNGGVNQCLLWDAFARMGMGWSAKTTGDTDINPIEAFDTPSTCTPNIQVNADQNFGNVCAGNEKANQLTIYNTATGDLIVRNVSRVSGSTDITVDPLPQVPVFISSGSHVDFLIRCALTATGSKTATIRIVSNDPDQPQIDLNYTCDSPPGDIRVTGSTDFGDVCPETQAEKTISVCNVGKCNLNVTSVAFYPACANFALINNPFPATVSPDSCNNVVVRFTPQSVGPKSCTLKITSDDPDSSTVMKTVTANTPPPSIDVPADQSFLPEVIQSVGACTTQKPFPISNTGKCNLSITNVAVTGDPTPPPAGDGVADYSLSGLPSYPIILQPGHVIGEGNFKTVFAPTDLDRDLIGTLTVRYVTDPFQNTTAVVTRNLCGEGVRTGARVLVTAGGVPVTTVKKIQIQRITSNRNRKIVDTVDTSLNVPLTTVTPHPPCPPFQYHKEYGTVINPLMLSPGSYTVTVQAVVNGKNLSKTVAFDVGTCDFNPNIVINFQ